MFLKPENSDKENGLKKKSKMSPGKSWTAETGKDAFWKAPAYHSYRGGSPHLKKPNFFIQFFISKRPASILKNRKKLS